MDMPFRRFSSNSFITAVESTSIPQTKRIGDKGSRRTYQVLLLVEYSCCTSVGCKMKARD
jgi:hypothetical protein